jgi:hypothetical protein
VLPLRDLKKGAPKKQPSIWWAIVTAIVLIIVLYAAAEKGREINDSKTRQLEKMEQTGKGMYR